MAVLNLLSASLSVDAPGGMWEFFLKLFAFVANYGWRIIFFTVILKLLLSPLDFYQKYKMKKNQRISKKLEPEVERLQKQYAGDKQSLQREQMKLQRSMGFSYFSACIPMIITLVVFFTFFAGMRNISQYEEFKQYVELYGAYSTEYTRLTGIPMPGYDSPTDYDDTDFNAIIKAEYERDPAQFLKDEEDLYVLYFEGNGSSFKQLYDKKNMYEEYLKALDAVKSASSADKQAELDKLNANQQLLNELNGGNAYDNSERIDEDYNKLDKEIIDYFKPLLNRGGILLSFAEQKGSEAAAKYYENHNNSFLWIKSLWVADAPWGQPIPAFGDFYNNVSKYFKGEAGGLNGEVLSELNKESTYNNVMGDVRQKDSAAKPNGYLILAILAIGFSLLSQFIMTRQQRKSGQVGTQGGAMKMMMFIMPAMTGVFAIMYTASFAIYMITNSIMSLALNLLFTAVLNMIYKGKDKEERSETGIVKYGRRDPNDFKKK